MPPKTPYSRPGMLLFMLSCKKDSLAPIAPEHLPQVQNMFTYGKDPATGQYIAVLNPVQPVSIGNVPVPPYDAHRGAPTQSYGAVQPFRNSQAFVPDSYGVPYGASQTFPAAPYGGGQYDRIPTQAPAPAGGRPYPSTENIVFCCYLPVTATEDQVRQLFSNYGQVLHTKLVRDPAGVSKGYAFITFATRDEANIAIGSLNDFQWDGRRLKVALKEERKF